MTFLKKVKNFIKRAYFLNHFPSLFQIIFSRKKNIVYYGFLGDGNFGDELVFEATKELFKDNLVIPFQRHMPLGIKAYCKMFPDSIHGIIVGGGTLIRAFNADKNYYKNLVKKGKPVFFHGTGTDKNLLDTEFWNTFIQKKKYGGVRGPLSIQYLKKNNFNFKEIGDAALFLNRISEHIIKKKEIIINFGTHKPDAELLRSRIEIIKFLKSINDKNYKLIYLPLHSIDLELGNILKSEIKELEVLDIAESYKDTLKLISEAEFCIGERLHFNVMNILANTNFISINYDNKHVDFLKSLNIEVFGYSPKDINCELIQSIFENTNKSINWLEVNDKVDKLKTKQESEKALFLENA